MYSLLCFVFYRRVLPETLKLNSTGLIKTSLGLHSNLLLLAAKLIYLTCPN